MFSFADLAGQEPLLTTHDCLYFKQKLSSEKVVDITLQLQQQFPYLRFEHEAIYPITGDAAYEARFADAAQFEREHRQRVAKEEENARWKKPTNLWNVLGSLLSH